MTHSHPTRRGFLAGMAGAALIPRRDAPDPIAAKGRRFLRDLFDPALDLLSEFRGAATYWLFHDNYLAAKLLDRTDPDLARRIRAATRARGVTHSGKIEILFGEAPDPLPFHHHRLVEVARVGDKVVKTEVITDRVNAGWRDYADLRFLAAVARAVADPAAARADLDAGFTFWDGRGLADRVTRSTGLYATYKLALALIAARRLGADPAPAADLRARLAALQGPEGGWITDYDQELGPRGLANVETTCLAILALETGA